MASNQDTPAWNIFSALYEETDDVYEARLRHAHPGNNVVPQKRIDTLRGILYACHESCRRPGDPVVPITNDMLYAFVKRVFNFGVPGFSIDNRIYDRLEDTLDPNDSTFYMTACIGIFEDEHDPSVKRWLYGHAVSPLVHPLHVTLWCDDCPSTHLGSARHVNHAQETTRSSHERGAQLLWMAQTKLQLAFAAYIYYFNAHVAVHHARLAMDHRLLELGGAVALPTSHSEFIRRNVINTGFLNGPVDNWYISDELKAGLALVQETWPDVADSIGVCEFYRTHTP
ncbi:hypothetical protein N3K66_006354 [Trichothecium roseum]|uniref:Uncharacterized protein n=1 Tax=Trichothecium roseum TaxID=47278 RepID=A0ACC0UV58_9HYPO|nr:hypothetical protein N3K66_006354 [Trichothecium roseum]